MSLLFKKFRRFRGKEDGSATIEFVLIFPALIMLFLTGFEAGYYMVRNVMLERAVDITVRNVRLGGDVPSYDQLKADICNETSIIADCMNTLMVSMEPVLPTPGNVQAISNAPTRCIDRSSQDEQQGNYGIGLQNQAMLVSVCALSQPLFPTTGLGVGMAVDSEGNYAIVAKAAFVNEPGTRALNTSCTGSGCTGGGSSGGGALQ